MYGVVWLDVDEDAFEEKLVEESSDVVGGLPVGGAAVFGQVEGHGDEGVVVAGDFVEFVDATLGVDELGLEGLLLAFDQVQGQGSLVVGFEEFFLFAYDALARRVQAGELGVHVGVHGVELLAHGVFELLAGVVCQAHVVVFALDEVFDAVDGHVSEVAVVAFALAGGA